MMTSLVALYEKPILGSVTVAGRTPEKNKLIAKLCQNTHPAIENLWLRDFCAKCDIFEKL